MSSCFLSDHDTAPGADVQTLGEFRGQLAAIAQIVPQPEQITFATRFRVILKAAPSMQYGVVIEDLNITHPEGQIVSQAVAGRQFANRLDGYTVVVTKSTVPVGTSEKVHDEIVRQLALRNSDLTHDVVSNPEFLKEGAAVADFQKPDRIIVGTKSDSAREKIAQLYAPFNRNHNKLVYMDARSAELT